MTWWSAHQHKFMKATTAPKYHLKFSYCILASITPSIQSVHYTCTMVQGCEEGRMIIVYGGTKRWCSQYVMMVYPHSGCMLVCVVFRLHSAHSYSHLHQNLYKCSYDFMCLLHNHETEAINVISVFCSMTCT